MDAKVINDNSKLIFDNLFAQAATEATGRILSAMVTGKAIEGLSATLDKGFAN